MTYDLTDPIFTDEDKAREHFEVIHWPNGPVCPHCGVTSEHVTRLAGKVHRPGLYQCNACRVSFTVKMGTVMESSHLSYRKWALAFHLMAASKKGISAHQLHRMLGITYKTAWFMAHRIREAMRPTDDGQLGGEGKFVELDETYVGDKTTAGIAPGGERPHLVEANDYAARGRGGVEALNRPLLCSNSGSTRAPNQVSSWRHFSPSACRRPRSPGCASCRCPSRPSRPQAVQGPRCERQAQTRRAATAPRR